MAHLEDVGLRLKSVAPAHWVSRLPLANCRKISFHGHMSDSDFVIEIDR